MDYLDCACFSGRTSIPIRCIVERVTCNNISSPSPSSTSTSPSSTSASPSTAASGDKNERGGGSGGEPGGGGGGEGGGGGDASDGSSEVETSSNNCNSINANNTNLNNTANININDNTTNNSNNNNNNNSNNPVSSFNSNSINNSVNTNEGNCTSSNGHSDLSVNLSTGDKVTPINGKVNSNQLKQSTNQTSTLTGSNGNCNQITTTTATSTSSTTTNNNNNTKDNNSSLSPSSTTSSTSPSIALRSLFGQHHSSHHHHHHHHHNSTSHHNHNHHNLLAAHLNHSIENSNNNNNSRGGDQGLGTLPASISPSGVVEQDSFAIITSGVLLSDLVKTALLHLGYSASEISGAKGFIQLRNWKPLTLDQITDSVDATVGDIMGDISSNATLRIILHRPRSSGPHEIEDKLLQILLAHSYSLLANSGCPIDQTLLAAIMGRNNRSGLEAELTEETRGKFDQWYMQQVFNQYRQMATLAAAQAHHQQAAAAAAAVMAATSQQQKQQAAAVALAAAVNAAAASTPSASSVDGQISENQINLSRNRGAAAVVAAAAAANCQSLLNLDLDAASLASNASSNHSNHMADNHSSQSHLHPHHAHQASTAAAGSSSHHHSARSSDFIVAVSGNGGNGRENSSGNGPGSGVSGHHNNRSSPNASGQYVRTRIRTSFDTEMELPKLHKWFGENQHPTRQQIQQYVRELNSLESRRGRKPLDVNNVVYWFKNARAAHKRHELKIVNGSQSPTLSNNILTGHSIHPKDGQDGRSGLAGRGQNDRRNDRSGNSNNLGGTLSGLHNSGLNSNRGLNEPYHDSNGNEEMGYDDDGSEGQDEYGPDGDDMMMDDDCSSQISQTLDLSVRPVKRQRSDSSPPGSPCTVPSSLSDLMGGTSPHLTAHPHFTVKDEPPSDEEDEDDSDATDDKDYYNIRHLGSGHSTSTTGPHSGGAGSGLVPSGYCGSESSLNGGNSRSHFNNNGSGQLSSHPDSPEEGRRIRRSRTFIDPTTEVPKLEQWFSLCTHPSQPQIVKYTDELNSSPYRLKYPKLESKNIQFWFKNRRAKSKRQNVPTSTANNNNNSVSSGNNGGHSGPQLGSSLSSLSSNCSVSSLSLAASSGPVSTPVSSSALTIDRLIGH